MGNTQWNRAWFKRYGEISKQRLDHAILTFFQHFRKLYVVDQAADSSKQLYTRLSELLGLHDHLLVLNLIVGKIATNLKCYMVRDHFPFLGDYRCSRSRTTFYHTIGLLIFMEDSLLKFRTSMDPLLQVFVSLESTPEEMVRTDTVKYALIGLMRDLKGIAMAINSRKMYSFLFDWLYPAHMPLLLKGISHWSDIPEILNGTRKVVKEVLVQQFPNGRLWVISYISCYRCKMEYQMAVMVPDPPIPNMLSAK
uniref:Exportin-7/Ran-binding protein 17 TPR repeats domain-containing protein n=1 Tax=Vitis vinifera TaxID=29760 RepID=A5AL44_VITVI|nr:hypothetical protein VITISV_005466 [Vitis vinifera]